MGKTLIVFAGKYDSGSAGAKRVRQFATGLRCAGDHAAVVSYYRGVNSLSLKISWNIDRWGVPHAGVNIVEGKLFNHKVLWDVLTLSSRLAELAVQACRDHSFDRVLLYGTSWFNMRVVVKRMSQLHVPLVIDFTEWMLFKGRPIREWLDQELFRRICVPKLAGLVIISPFWESYARKVAKPFILISAMADDELADLTFCNTRDFNLVYVGILFHRDRPEIMLDGVRLAIERGVNIRFHIIGRPGSFPESTRIMRRIDADPLLRNRVLIHGWVSRDELLKCYSEASSFLLIRENDWESLACFPTRIPEYLSSGVPVITSKTTGLHSSFIHRENIWLLPAGNEAEKLADAIGYLATHQDDGKRIGLAGRELAKKEFAFDKHGRRLSQFFDSLQETFE